jgi:hypothetical protein
MSPQYWTVVREPQGDESPHVGPFTSREEAQALDWHVVPPDRPVLHIAANHPADRVPGRGRSHRPVAR